MGEMERQVVVYEDETAEADGTAALEAEGWQVVERAVREPREVPRRLGVSALIQVTYRRG